jgi:hypothetical protein
MDNKTFIEEIVEEWNFFKAQDYIFFHIDKPDNVKVFIVNEEKRIGIAESKDFGLIFDEGMEIQNELD